MTLPTYSTGTVSVANGGAVVTGVGTIWSGVNVKEGDFISINNFPSVQVIEVTDVTHLKIRSWANATQSAVAYVVDQNFSGRVVGVAAAENVSTLVAALNTSGFYFFVDPAASVPDPSLGADGQYAFQATTGKLWLRTAGVWVFVGVYKGINPTGAWSGATAYNINDVVSLSGSSYICVLAHTNHTPPNATYWTLLASVGSTGPATLSPVAPWLTTTAYVVGPPASYVSQSGSSYQCLISHTSGVFATDLAAGKWGLVSQAGVNAPTYGGTSATSFLIGVGSKPFTTQAGLAYVVGSRIRAASNASGVNFMEGLVTAYSGTTLTINIDTVGGSGTFADWNLSIAGNPGSGAVSGIAGNSGNFTLEGGLTNDVNKLVMQQMLPGGRLTLTSATPVTTTDVTAATAIYYAPTIHPWVPVYNGTQMRLYQFTASATDAVGLSVTFGANWTLNTNYDGFVINDSGTIRLGSGPSWNAGAVAGSDTTRGTGAGSTELQMYNGIWTNKNTITIRYANGSTVSVPANQATYVGSFRTVAAGQAEDSMAKRFLYNAYNQVQRNLKNATETTLVWNYSLTTKRQANGNAANQLDCLVGLSGNLLDSRVTAASDTTGALGSVGIGINSTTVDSAQESQCASGTNRNPITATLRTYPAIGRQFFPWLEFASSATPTVSFYGQQTPGPYQQSGISGTVLM